MSNISLSLLHLFHQGYAYDINFHGLGSACGSILHNPNWSNDWFILFISFNMAQKRF